jgi:hypothetical protein
VYVRVSVYDVVFVCACVCIVVFECSVVFVSVRVIERRREGVYCVAL